MAMISFERLETTVFAASEKIRDLFKQAGQDTMFVQVTMTVDKYDGLEIKYTVGKGRYDTSTVTGNELAPAVTEYLRRNGWDIQHNVKQIGFHSKSVD